MYRWCFLAMGIDLTVKDNGNGFTPPQDMGDLPRSGKLGLMGMKERVWLLGGKIRVNSVPGRGTTLLVHIPILEETQISIACLVQQYGPASRYGPVS